MVIVESIRVSEFTIDTHSVYLHVVQKHMQTDPIYILASACDIVNMLPGGLVYNIVIGCSSVILGEYIETYRKRVSYNNYNVCIYRLEMLQNLFVSTGTFLIRKSKICALT